MPTWPLLSAHTSTRGQMIFTLNLQSALFPHASFAVQVTVVVPPWNVEPLAGVQVTLTTPPQLSDVVGANVTTFLHEVPESDATVMSVGQVMPGGVVSTTVTVWLHSAWLPQASFAVQVRVAENVVPHSPFVTVPTTVTAGFPSQSSFAVGASNVQAVTHSTFLGCAQVMLGGVVSTTVTVWLHSAWLPQASFAVQVCVAENVVPHSAFVTVPTTVTAGFP